MDQLDDEIFGRIKNVVQNQGYYCGSFLYYPSLTQEVDAVGS